MNPVLDQQIVPHYEKYYELDTQDLLHIVTVRNDNDIIGYYISFLFIHPHYKDHLFATNDILFIHKKYRGSTVAYRMFKFAEKELKKLGVSVMTIHMKNDFPFERLCQSLDMDKHEIVYSKYLGD